MWHLYSCCKVESTAPYCQLVQKNDRYCSMDLRSGSTISDPFLQEWTCPMSTEHCDQDVDIIIRDQTKAKREWTWPMYVPTSEAADWNCKYKMSVEADFLKSVNSS